MAQNKKIGVPGKIIGSQAREVVANVLEFMKNEATNGATIPLARFKERLLAATGIGGVTYRRIQKEAAAVKSGKQAAFTSPKKTRKRNAPKKDLNDDEIKTIRSLIHNFFIIEKRQPTVKVIQQKIIASGIKYQGGPTTLRYILKNMGFSCKRTVDGRSVWMESHDIRLKRIKYLKQIKEYRRENRPIIFTSKSYIYSSQNQGKCSDDSKKPMSKTPRIIMVHAGGKDGFVENGLLMFPSGSKIGDYHEDMNPVNFIKWVQTQLIPNFPYNGVLVIDNAPYHNVVKNKEPTSATKKQDMINWLAQRGILHDGNLTKPELYEIIKLHKNKTPQYVLDAEMAQHGFRVLRLPPCHPELNPLEKIFTQIKNCIAARNSSLKLNDIMALVKEKFDSVTKEDWVRLCEHADRTVDEYMEREHLMDDAYEEFDFIVNTGDSDDEEKSEEEEEEEGEEEEFSNMSGVIWL